MIVSTGMNDIKSVAKAVNIMEKYGVPYALMHTTNLYPTKPEWVRLGAMQEMMREFPDVPIGLSDHTLNNNACIAALALGADLVERHFTDEMARSGPDIICSMDEAACEELIQAAIEVPMMRGGTKGALPEEQVTIDFAFATVVTIAPVKKGEVFTKENIWVKRPGTGEILAKDYTKILGFDNTGMNYLNSIKNKLNIPNVINKDSLIYKYELLASLVYDLINNTNTYSYELQNKPIIKGSV